MAGADAWYGRPGHAGLCPVPRSGAIGMEGYGVLDYRAGGAPTWARGQAGRDVWFSSYAEARDWAAQQMSPTAERPELEPAVDSPTLARLRAATQQINARPVWMR
ncbi:hypothetical protein [Kitasatospora sp. NPDC059817]|uniref:hypothetical protein n=1 Tax=Kitasatospora sp. NPDC059817 TaxID=3346961 RepID=UPI003647B1CD